MPTEIEPTAACLAILRGFFSLVPELPSATLAASLWPLSPYPDRQADNRDFQKLGIHLSQKTDLRLATLFPASSGRLGNNSVKIRHLEQG